jgi:hypothetical protein
MRKVSHGTWCEVESAYYQPLAPKKGYRWKRLRYTPPAPKQPEYVQYKRADWQMLKQSDQEGVLRSVYLDESGFEYQMSTI